MSPPLRCVRSDVRNAAELCLRVRVRAYNRTRWFSSGHLAGGTLDREYREGSQFAEGESEDAVVSIDAPQWGERGRQCVDAGTTELEVCVSR